MTAEFLRLFMWGYQPFFRDFVRSLANDTLKYIGAAAEVEALLVGVRRPDACDGHPICIEPEEGVLPFATFDRLHDDLASLQEADELQHTFFGPGDPANEEKSETVLRQAIRSAVASRLDRALATRETRTILGLAVPVERHYVVPVLLMRDADLGPGGSLEWRLPRGGLMSEAHVGHGGLIERVLDAVAKEASAELERPDPGRHHGRMRSPAEVARLAARDLLWKVALALGQRDSEIVDLFDHMNALSGTRYEGSSTSARVVLTRVHDESASVLVRFATPVPLARARWARKVLEMASEEVPVVASCKEAYGLGQASAADNVSERFTIEFVRDNTWRLRRGAELLLISKHGIPSIPRATVSRERFDDNYRRLLSEVESADVELAWKLFEAAGQHAGGSLLVFARDAAEEAERLGGQGMRIDPMTMDVGLLRRVTAIDGAVLLDPRGRCHAVGVILDGIASRHSSAERGARYNSALRYVMDHPGRMAIVVSEDGGADLLPLLRPRVERATIESMIAALEGADVESFYEPQGWLEGHRFYLNRSQCERINAALARIADLPREVGRLVIVASDFAPDEGMNDSYLI